MKVKLSHGSLYLFGEFFSKGIPFLLLPYLTRKLGPEGFGELSYSLSIVAILMLFLSISQEAALLSYYYKKGKYAFRHLVVAGFFINIISAIVLALFYVVLSYFIHINNFFLLLSLAILGVTYSFYLATLQAQQRVLNYVLVQTSYSLLLVFFVIIFFEFFPSYLSVDGRLFAQDFAYLLITLPFVFYFIQQVKQIDLTKVKIYIFYILGYGLPLLIHQTGIYIRGQFDKLFLFHTYSEKMLGIYSGGAQIATVLVIFLMALNKAIVPQYYQALKNGSLNINGILKWTKYSLVLCGAPAVIAALIPEVVYLWVLGDGFEGVRYYVVLFLFGFGLMLPYLIMVNYFFYHSKTMLLSKVTLFSSLVYVVALFMFSLISIELVPYALIVSNISLIVVLALLLIKFKNI